MTNHTTSSLEVAVPKEYDLYIPGSQLLSLETIPFPYTYFLLQKYNFYSILQNKNGDFYSVPTNKIVHFFSLIPNKIH